jgi:ankyrin repeat protein
LEKAVRDGDEVAVRAELDRINASARNEHGETFLILAALKGHTAIAAALLKAWPDGLHVTDYKRTSALICAARNGHISTVGLLLSAGAMPNEQQR